MIYNELVNTIINALELRKNIFNVVIEYGLPNLIATNRASFFIPKFLFLFCYFLDIKLRLSTAFYWQTDNQTYYKNSRIKAYLQVFVTSKQSNKAKLLLIGKFAYKNTKNIITGHTQFELIICYHLKMSYKDNINFCFQSKTANKLLAKL